MNNQKGREIKESEISTSSFTSYGGYTKAYVKEMENELSKLVSENIYLKSNEYLTKILSNKDQYLNKILSNKKDNTEKSESKINALVEENEKLHQENNKLRQDKEEFYKEYDKLHQEKESMSRKINLLCLLIRKMCHESMDIDRENVFSSLKEILDE